MLSVARVRRSRNKRKSERPENAFSVQVASGNSTHAFCILSCWWAGYKKSEQILGRIPCYGMVQDAFWGPSRPLGLPLRGNPSESLRMTMGKNLYRT